MQQSGIFSNLWQKTAFVLTQWYATHHYFYLFDDLEDIKQSISHIANAYCLKHYAIA